MAPTELSAPCEGTGLPLSVGDSAKSSLRRPQITGPPSTINGNAQSPASSLGLQSATGQFSRRSPRTIVARQSTERSDELVQPYGPSLAAGDPSPALVGGASLPPHSPSKNNHLYIEAVGIPLQRKARKIDNVEEN